MERGSDMHSPRVDEELDDATEGLQRGEPSESRTDEARKVEEAEADDENEAGENP
jgi:hypothetical protein